MKPFFSVIIPCFNRFHLLQRTLSSVFQQTFKDFEVIVVDDGSTDGTIEFVESFGDCILFLKQANHGPGAARNLGVRNSNADYISFLDSDDLWFPWTLETFASQIMLHEYPAILTGRLVAFDRDEELQNIGRTASCCDVHADYLSSSRCHYAVGAGTMVIRRDIFCSANGFDERQINMEDHDLTLTLGLARGFVAIQSPVTLGWRRHAGSVTFNFNKTFLGAKMLIEHELSGEYPGGTTRQRERRRVITGHTRAASFECLRAGLASEAWWIYWNTLSWNLRLIRYKYLIGFPLFALIQREKVANKSRMP